MSLTGSHLSQESFLGLVDNEKVREHMSGSEEKGSVGKRKRHCEQVNHRGTVWAMNGTVTGRH